jgi:hypothetical protein
MLVLTPAELAAVIARYGIDGGAVLLEGRKDVVSEQRMVVSGSLLA